MVGPKEIKREWDQSLLSQPHEDTVRRWPSANQEESLYRSWIGWLLDLGLCLQNCEKINFSPWQYKPWWALAQNFTLIGTLHMQTRWALNVNHLWIGRKLGSVLSPLSQPYSKLMNTIWFPFYRWGHWSTERLSNLPRVTQAQITLGTQSIALNSIPDLYTEEDTELTAICSAQGVNITYPCPLQCTVRKFSH